MVLSNQDPKNWDYFQLGEKEKVTICKKCLNPSTRPRLEFNKEGVCNACIWAEKKKTEIDWKARWKELEALCDKYRIMDGSNWDVIVPCSGGKDGSHVAWTLKNKLGMHPLCITWATGIETPEGRANLKAFINSGFDHMYITPNPKIYRAIDKRGFVKYGRPKAAFNDGMSTAIIGLAIKLKIPFIMWGEEGEEEYGGTTERIGKFKINREYLIKCYYSGHEIYSELKGKFSEDDLRWWKLPSEKEFINSKVYPTHWSHFENWDSYAHYQTALKHCGFKPAKKRQIGTYSTYGQLDDAIHELYMYMAYIKFGFGRCLADAGIDIRGGRMTREEGLKMVKKYDGVFPYKYLPDYLAYYDMTEKEFFDTIDSFRSPDLWEKVDGKWKLRFKYE